MFNKSRSYLLPLLFKELDIPHTYLKYVSNTYVRLKDYNSTNIFILEVNKSEKEDKEFAKFINILYLCKGIDSSYEDSNGVLIFIIIFNKFKDEYQYYIDGKYSKFSNHAKQTIIKFWSFVYGKDGNKFVRDVTDILYQNARLRNEIEQKLAVRLPLNAELSSICNLTKETLIYDE